MLYLKECGRALGRCDFSGTLPTSIGKMKALTYVTLNNNDFFGPLPAELWTLNRLTTLCATSFDDTRFTRAVFSVLSNNSFMGTIALSNGGLNELTSL